jgi:hypothetical protein
MLLLQLRQLFYVLAYFFHRQYKHCPKHQQQHRKDDRINAAIPVPSVFAAAPLSASMVTTATFGLVPLE